MSDETRLVQSNKTLWTMVNDRLIGPATDRGDGTYLSAPITIRDGDKVVYGSQLGEMG